MRVSRSCLILVCSRTMTLYNTMIKQCVHLEKKPHLFFLNFDVSDCIYWIMNATVFLLVDKKRALQTSMKECIYTRLVWYVIYTVFL